MSTEFLFAEDTSVPYCPSCQLKLVLSHLPVARCGSELLAQCTYCGTKFLAVERVKRTYNAKEVPVEVTGSKSEDTFVEKTPIEIIELLKTRLGQLPGLVPRYDAYLMQQALSALEILTASGTGASKPPALQMEDDVQWVVSSVNELYDRLSETFSPGQTLNLIHSALKGGVFPKIGKREQ